MIVFILRCNTTNKMCTGKDQQVLYRALDVQRLLVLPDVIRSLSRKLNEPEAKELSREKPV